MIRDFSATPEPREIDTDICIIGAGAAGITLAAELAGHRAKVLLVESGGFEFDATTQGLYFGETVGTPYWPLGACRLRFFGGTTNHWTGRCVPLTEWDFAPRSWEKYSGWPITRAELDPHYRRARAYCELDGEDWFDLSRYTPDQLQPLAADPERIETRMAQWSPPTRFGERHREAITQAANIDLLLYANVTAIETVESAGHVTGVSIAGLSGARGVVRARFVIVACGGIENARILLLSDGVQKSGLGNGRDLVGRFFMEHAHLMSAYGTLTGGLDAVRSYAGLNIGDASLGAALAVTPAAKARHEINDYIGTFEFNFDETAGYPSMTRLLKGESDDHLEDLWHVVSDLDDAAVSAWERLRGRTPERDLASPSFGLFTISEQHPNPDSRVTLIDQRDDLGQRMVQLDWRLTETDKRTVRIGGELVGRELGRLGLGRLKVANWLYVSEGPWDEGLWGGNHHMGTTRMSDDPSRGVVDRNCRVHDIDNLFVAGSSVFATGGAGNPTFSIVALAIRLADHLKSIV
jgi:choline dehydrogenase-like flavoprotein